MEIPKRQGVVLLFLLPLAIFIPDPDDPGRIRTVCRIIENDETSQDDIIGRRLDGADDPCPRDLKLTDV